MPRKKETRKLFLVLLHIEDYTDENTIIEFYNANGALMGKITYAEVAKIKPSLYDKQVVIAERTHNDNKLKIQFIEQI